MQFGPYRITGQVGAGGMGVVFRAVHVDTGVRAALKTVRAIDPSLLSGLRREVRALSRLRHSGIVRILDEGLDDLTPWYAMELLEGVTLRELLRSADAAPVPAPGSQTTGVLPRSGVRTGELEAKKPSVDGARTEPALSEARASVPALPHDSVHPPPPRARRVELLRAIPRLCDALAFLHGEGLVHLDLKPDNIFVTQERPVLMDFGLAARSVAGQGREDLDVVSRGRGSVSYVAPEQLLGDRIDARADLYGLGCILYEIVTGRPPFVAERSAAVIFSHLQLTPAPPSELAPDIEPELDALILTLLEKAPEDRVGYASDVARELRALIPDAPPPEEGPPARDYLYRPRIVCREAPLAALKAEVGLARAGSTRVVLVGGESGVGKTRLAAEVARQEADGTLAVLAGECISHGIDEAHGTPLSPFAEVFHAIADRCRDAGTHEMSAFLSAYGPLLAAFAPALREVPGAEEWSAPEPLPARAARARLVRAATDALAALAHGRPLLFIVDDAHWADDLTMEVLQTLAAEAEQRSAPLLVIATYRTDETTPELRALIDVPGVTSVLLGRLDGDGARAMVDGMLGHAELPPAMVDRVSEHAEGNPFFIAEYLRAAVREDVLNRVDGRWTASEEAEKKAAALALPHSIRDLVARRFDRLGTVARAVAEVASVMGGELSPDELTPHVDAGDDELADALLELVATQMHEALPDGRLRFVHSKLHEGVYETLSLERRTGLHLSVAEAIERTPARPGRAALLAHHYVEAGASAQAVDALEEAALESLGNGSHSAAETYLERARGLADRHGLEVPPLRRARWDRGLGDARFALGDLGAAAEHGRAALERLGHSLPSTGLGATLAVMRESAASVLSSSPTAEEAAALIEASLSALRIAEVGYYQLDAATLLGGSVLATTLAGRAGAEAQAAKAYTMLGVVLSSMGMRARGTRLCERAVRGAENGDDKAGLAFTLYAKAMNDVAYGDFDAAALDAQRAVDLARSVGDEYNAGAGETVLGHIEYWRGDLVGSADRYRRLAATSRSVRATQHEAWGLYAEARSLVHSKAGCARAVELCRRAKTKLVGQNDAASELICEALLAYALLGEGARSDAIVAARSASAMINKSTAAIWPNIPGYRATAEVWLALASTEAGALDQARAAQRALAGLVRGAPIAESTAKLYAGRIALAGGKTRRARSELEAAARIAEARGVPLDEGKARIALASTLEGEAREREMQTGRALLERLGASRAVPAASPTGPT